MVVENEKDLARNENRTKHWKLQQTKDMLDLLQIPRGRNDFAECQGANPSAAEYKSESLI